MSGVQRLLRTWWREGVDYDWMTRATASHSALGAARVSVGSGGILTLVVNAPAMLSASGPQYPVGSAIVWLISALAIAWLVRWWLLPWPGAVESVALFAVGDLVITAACVLSPNQVARSIGLVLLVIMGMHLCVFHSPRVLAGHTIWALLSVVAVAVPLLGDGDDATAAVVIVTMAAAIAVPPGLQFGYWMFRRDMLSDPLTMLLSRRGLEYQSSVLFDRADPVPICVLVIDLDRFKTVNDTFGHSAGDEVLVRTADRLRTAAPRGSIVSRIGGEEFAIVTRTAPAAAAEIAERVRSAVAEPMDSVSVTASIGVAGATLAPGHPAFVDDLIQRADNAMYQAKQRGGDTVTIAAPLAGATSPAVR
ncbi:diguanylate cyclase domain-containing protein [Nocardia sp. NPDC051570]|uniref:GGDEF domain-containing protein n=1 Tax=Nocardia sp. NPDC051570 TaxID=3364324 RepID=UPI00379BD1CB